MSAPTVREVATPTPDAAEQVNRLVTDIVRSAAPRLGNVAVVRIARPLSAAVVAVRAELLESAQAWHQVGEALNAEDPTDPASVMFALGALESPTEDEIAELIRTHVSLDPTELRQSSEDAARAIAALYAGPQPIALGDVLTTREQLNACPDGTLITGSRTDVGPVEYIRHEGSWFAPGSSRPALLVCAAGWTVERLPVGAS